MHYSEPLKSSPHCLPSPDGRFIATVLPSSIVIRAVDSLDVVRTVRLPSDLSGGVTAFIWSPSSRRVLLTTSDQFHVFSAAEGDFHGTVRIPSSVATKATFVDFGATDNEACVWSSFGIKLTIINLASSKAVDISNPKFYNALSAPKGCSFRPKTHHLALLTRTAGKDMISIHSPDARDVQRSWQPDTIDAQSLSWTPDGRWLVVCESSAQGHRVLFYTSDGHIFRDWRGPLPHAAEDMDLQYGAGVRTLAFSPNGRHAAIANGSSCICMLNGQSMAEEMRLRHTQTIQPKDTLQIWQEQINPPIVGSSLPTFVRAMQPVIPPGLLSANAQEPKAGCNLVKFDSSSGLLATRLEDAPSTIWIWDISAFELRAVIMYHANISRVEWHPVQPEMLLIRCEGEKYGGLVFVWDPISDGPRTIDFAHRLAGGKVNGRTYATWLKTTTTQSESAAVFFTDHATCMLASLAETDGETLPWKQAFSSNQQRKGMDFPSKSAASAEDSEDEGSTDLDEGMSDLDDTFHFKKGQIR
ncbi:hypothetical protein F4810DRAFT_96797 [Camillea tinctor]|nr:hypothetical protein F4810DRAFT_96797 [Camillea tinctor]